MWPTVFMAPPGLPVRGARAYISRQIAISTEIGHPVSLTIFFHVHRREIEVIRIRVVAMQFQDFRDEALPRPNDKSHSQTQGQLTPLVFHAEQADSGAFKVSLSREYDTAI